MLDEQGRALEHVSVNANGDTLVLAGSTGAQLQVLELTRSENMLTEEVTTEQNRIVLPQMTEVVKNIFIDPRQHWLYVINGRATADVFSLRDRSLNGRYKLADSADTEVTATGQLVGGISLIVGDSRGGLAQWFMARDPDGESRLKQIRTFQLGRHRSCRSTPKSAARLHRAGRERPAVFHSTAHRTLLVEPSPKGHPGPVAACQPYHHRTRRQAAAAEPAQPAPGNFLQRVVGKVWYENYDEPKYVWRRPLPTPTSSPSSACRR